MTRPRWDKELGIRGIRINVSTNLRATRQTLGDVSELREALMNLVLNAVDAMPEGGSLTLSSDVKNDEVVVEVSDTGTGMTDETRKRCLEPFFTTKGVMGTGLGLSMVHGIVTRHNGTMKIDTTLGRGTRIQIRLPCAPGKAPTSGTKPEKAEDHPVMAPLKILVVDDEPLLLKFIERSLQMDGHSIKTAQTGHEAIGKASAETFDLVITDRAMPDVNGDLVARAVKKHHPETPVILMTGFGDLMKDEGEHPEGVDIILSKPATVREMRRGIAEAMALRRKTP
jgi:CheY-like chemotaxis protein